MKKSQRDADILAEVLDFYGADGKNWSPRGWDNGPQRCILGAVAQAAEMDLSIWEEREAAVGKRRTKIIGALTRAIKSLYPDRWKEAEDETKEDYGDTYPKYEVIVSFNDAEDTGWQEMQQVIKQAEFTLRYGDEELPTVDNEGNPR